MSSVAYHKYKLFKLSELFYKIEVNSLGYKTGELPKNPTGYFILPALTAGVQNQGLNNYVPIDGATILKNVISVSANGANTGVMFFQSQNFTVLQDAYAIDLIDKPDNIKSEVYIYLVAALQKTVYGNFTWTNKAGWNRIKTLSITLPVTDSDEIDFEYMESYIRELELARIRELELARIRELEAYLQVTGFSDYKLTTDEKQVLERCRAGGGADRNV